MFWKLSHAFPSWSVASRPQPPLPRLVTFSQGRNKSMLLLDSQPRLLTFPPSSETSASEGAAGLWWGKEPQAGAFQAHPWSHLSPGSRPQSEFLGISYFITPPPEVGGRIVYLSCGFFILLLLVTTPQNVYDKIRNFSSFPLVIFLYQVYFSVVV